MTATGRYPPLDDSIRILPGFIDFHAEHHPSLSAYAFGSREDSSVLTRVSYAEFAEASHRAAHIVRPGRKGQDGDIVAILINTDALLYLALLTGIARTGLVVRVHDIASWLRY